MIPYFFFFDTETSARTSPNKKWTNQQEVIEIAYLITDRKFNTVMEKQFMIRDVATEIFEHQTKYTMDDLKNGKEWKEVYESMIEDMKMVYSNNGAFIAHNLVFDRDVIIYSSQLKNLETSMFSEMIDHRGYCTKEKTTNICKIPSQYGRGYKWPKLQELHDFLHPTIPYVQTHLALDDVRLLKNCFRTCLLRKLI